MKSNNRMSRKTGGAMVNDDISGYWDAFSMMSSPGPRNKHTSGALGDDLHTFRFSPPPHCSMSSPMLPSLAPSLSNSSSASASSSPSTPVDVRSVSRVRRITTTKLAFSYTFGAGLPSSPKVGDKRKRSLD